ncbi:hypothetical protein [Oryzomonas rubra]|uniref:Uncharacterized protein n=1 Tax=Oryzomonas rubra TaxID=2509454 RepID=A0A5A9X7N6_9BACT|nr:hypothetical protein [Oryzomonas rubra]KAA0888804.1 hypothetical protein ET418_15605 [Oryzomonas rubra]
MEEEDIVSLLNLGRGAAIEKFDDEFKRVLDNVVDLNTTEGVREITLKVKIKPNADRDRCDVSVDCGSKLASVKPFNTMMFVGRTPQGAVATECNPHQLQLDLDATKKLASVTKI